jgi:hypothetical protein
MDNDLKRLLGSLEALKANIKDSRNRLKEEEEDKSAVLSQLQDDKERVRNTLVRSP